MDIGGAFNLTVSSSNKFSVDASGNVTNAGTLTATGKLKTFGDLEVIGGVTVGTTLGVTGQVTASSFKVTNATNEALLLRAPGTAAALTKAELDAAAGFSIQPPIVNSTLPNGNSIQLKSITFDGGTRTFALQAVDNTVFTPISSANLLVSVGGIIQRPDTDYIVSGSNITFPASAWSNPPAAGLSCFIIAFGGLGGLRQNQDWDTTDKGVLLVGSGTDNLGIKLGVGSNDTVLTADSTTSSGVAWKTPSAAIPSGSVILFYQSTAPIGWTRVDTQNNKALRVVSGTGPTGGGQGSSTGGSSGGSTNFTSVFTSRTPSGSVSGGNVNISFSGSTDNHSLTRAQLPNHRHGMNHSHYINDPGHRHQWGVDDNIGASGANNPDANPGGNYRDTTYANTGVYIDQLSNDVNNNRGVTYPAYENGTVVTGDASGQGLNGEGHSHGFSGSGSGSVSASFSGNEMDFAVQYIDVILCSKN